MTMRLSLDDVPKTISRRAGERTLKPLLLRSGDRDRELAALIGLYESWLGHERAAFPADRAAELIGDYRLARCLEMCLAEWYLWQSPAWPGSLAPERREELAARGITSPSTLRLALYDMVNATAGGYLTTERRDATLASFAASLGLDGPALETLLYLDADERAMLARAGSETPSPAALAERYNQRAFEALIGGAARIELAIAPPVAPARAVGEGLGTIVKRVCYLARAMGVQYDVAFDAPEAARAVSETSTARVAERPAAYQAPRRGSADSLDSLATAGSLIVTLYGPQELTGTPAQYGDRLARLCRALLGYRRGSREGSATLADANVRGTAVVYLHGRSLLFALDDRVLRLIGAPGTAGESGHRDGAASATLDFDSELERALYGEFSALEAAGEAHGWRLEREPEPIVVAGTILVPDFALARGARRVYLEIAGYWRPEYRERKLRKLLAVREYVALAVAAPESARGELGAAASVMPFLWYRNRVSAQGVLGLLERVYDDRERRLAALDVARVLDELRLRGRLPPDEAYAALHCYTRNELTTAIERLRGAADRTVTASPDWIEGVGLCGGAWLEAALEALRGILSAAGTGRVPLDELRPRLAGALDLPHLPEAAVETLAQRAGLVVVRTSIFDAYVTRVDAEPARETPRDADLHRDHARPTQPRGRSRRKHSVEPQSQHSLRTLFSPEHMGPDDAEPNTPTRATNTTSKEARRGR